MKCVHDLRDITLIGTTAKWCSCCGALWTHSDLRMPALSGFAEYAMDVLEKGDSIRELVDRLTMIRKMGSVAPAPPAPLRALRTAEQYVEPTKRGANAVLCKCKHTRRDHVHGTGACTMEMDDAIISSDARLRFTKVDDSTWRCACEEFVAL